MILLLVPRATLSREPPSVRREDRTAQPTPTNPINVALGPPLSTPAPSALRRLRPAPALVRRRVASRLPGAGHRLSLPGAATQPKVPRKVDLGFPLRVLTRSRAPRPRSRQPGRSPDYNRSLSSVKS